MAGKKNEIVEKIMSFGDGYYRVFWDTEKKKYVIKKHILENPVTKKEYNEYTSK